METVKSEVNLANFKMHVYSFFVAHFTFTLKSINLIYFYPFRILDKTFKFDF